MHIRVAGPQDVSQLAQLLWRHAAPDEQAKQSVASFAVDLAAWWAGRASSHLAFVAQPAEPGTAPVGVAWLALVERVPRPGVTSRRSADIQSVFVLPDHRGSGIGSALVQAACEHATQVGAHRVTVHSGRTAVAMYDRLGFASSRQLLQRASDQASPSAPEALPEQDAAQDR